MAIFGHSAVIDIGIALDFLGDSNYVDFCKKH